MSLIEELLDLQIPGSIRLSPNGQRVVYTSALTFGHKKGEHALSTLWLADIGKPSSARQLTSGLYNDHDPKWSPNGESIAFISDRKKQDESSAIYILPLGGGEPYPLTPAEDEAGIENFDFNPDGKSIAYLSADEKTEEKKAKDKEKDDAQVWGEDWSYNRLRLVDVATKKVTTLVSEDVHITMLAWNNDGTSIAFTAVRTPHIESPFLYGTTFSVIDMKTKDVRKLCHFPNKVREAVFWTKSMHHVGSTICFCGPAAVTHANSSSMVFAIDTGPKEPDWNKLACGETDCAMTLRKAGSDIMVLVESGMEDQIRMLGGKTMATFRKEVLAWDAAFTTDSDEVVLAVVLSDVDHPAEVFTTTVSGGAMVQVSNHGHTFAGRKLGTASVLSCPSEDDKFRLDSLWITPHTAESQDGVPSRPQPTVVLSHGGPYGRTSEAFDAYYFMWAPLLLSHGYAILLPNYRGGSGRGEEFAAYAQGVGKEDYEDVITLINHAVEKSYADPDRLVIGGWSQGGFLSFLCSVRNGTHKHGWKFQAAIPGAGVSDSDTLIMTSDVSCMEAELGGGKPWQQSKGDTSNRKGAAIWEFGDAVKNGVTIPPMLMLHGEKDERVPIEQSRGMRRALEDAGLPFTFVMYPREGHIFKERKHYVDMAERVVAWCDKYIGKR